MVIGEIETIFCNAIYIIGTNEGFICISADMVQHVIDQTIFFDGMLTLKMIDDPQKVVTIRHSCKTDAMWVKANATGELYGFSILRF